MEIEELIDLINKSLIHFNIAVQKMIDKIISFDEEASSIDRQLLTKEFLKQIYIKAFQVPIYTTDQLDIHTPETKLFLESFKAFLGAPGFKMSRHTFRVPYPAGRIVSNYLNNYPKVLFSSLTSGLSQLPEFIVLRNNLVTNYHAFLDKVFSYKIEPEKRADQFLSGLIYYCIINSLRDKLTDSLKERYSEVFINEIEGKPKKIHYLASLSGLAIYEEVSLGLGISLKKFDPSDLDDIDSFAVFINQQQINLPHLFILKISSLAENPSNVLELGDNLLRIIRLFTFGDVFISYHLHFSESMLFMSTLKKQSFDHKKPNYIWSLPSQGASVLTKFSETFLPLFQNQLRDDCHKAIQFALERFDWALRDDLGIERRLLFAIMGLEPLFLPEFTTGKATKLSERVSTLLAEFNFNLRTVEKHIKRAYKYRNIIAHGSAYPQNWKEELDNLYPKILNYLRVSLIFFIYYITQGRDKIAQIIIDSVNSSANITKLRKLTKPIIKEFVVCFSLNHHALL